jgi:glycosyltransferase involved in cell wall biosynthesis
MTDDQIEVAVDCTPLYAPRTGIGLFCEEILSALSARSDVALSAFAVTWRQRGRLPKLVPPGIRVVQTPMPARPINKAWTVVDFPPIEWFVGRVDVVHGTNFIVPPARRAAKVVTVHDLTPLHHPELSDAYTSVFPRMVRRAIAAGAWVHTLSHFVAGEVIEAFAIPPERVRPIHLGIPGAVGDPAAGTPVPLPQGTGRYILAIGTIEPRKDYPGLIAAFDRVTAPDVALVIAGGDGWGVEAFEQALAASPNRQRIVRLGYVDDETRARLLADAALLAFPSVYEGFGFPPLEAMRQGIPVVATAAGAVPEVVGEAAVLVDPGDPDALAAAIDRVLDDEGLRAGLVGRGRVQAAGFDWTSTASGLAQLYRDAAGQ